MQSCSYTNEDVHTHGRNAWGSSWVFFFSLVEATLKDALEGEWNKLEALAAVELVLELHPGDKMDTQKQEVSSYHIIPHTWRHREWGTVAAGLRVHREVVRGTGGTLLNSTRRHHAITAEPS